MARTWHSASCRRSVCKVWIFGDWIERVWREAEKQGGDVCLENLSEEFKCGGGNVCTLLRCGR